MIRKILQFIVFTTTVFIANQCFAGTPNLKLKNQIDGKFNTLGSLIDPDNGIAGYIISIGLTLFIIAILYGGIKYILSAGREEQTEKAKNTITYAIIGLVIIALSYSIIVYLISLFN